jgi:hypothetical protein
LVRSCLDLAQLARRDVGIEDIEPFIVGEEKRRVAARPRRRECATAAATVGRRRRQIPERQSGESGARADQQRFLNLAHAFARNAGPSYCVLDIFSLTDPRLFQYIVMTSFA